MFYQNMNFDLTLSGRQYCKCMQHNVNMLEIVPHDSFFCLNDAAAGLCFIGIVLRAHDSHLDLPEKDEVRVSKEAIDHGSDEIETQEIKETAEAQPDTCRQHHPA